MKCFHSWKKIFSESAPVLVALSFFSILAGITLEYNLEFLSKFPSLLLLVPAFVDACGDISEMFAAHVSALLHSKINKTKERKEINLNIKTSIFISIIFFGIISSISYLVSSFINLPQPAFIPFFAAVMASALVSITASIAIATATAFFTKKHNLDPDNFEAPVLSTFSDLVGVIIFISISAFLLA